MESADEIEEISFGGNKEDLERNQQMVDNDETDILDSWYSKKDNEKDVKHFKEIEDFDMFDLPLEPGTIKSREMLTDWEDRYYKLLDVLNTFRKEK